jgi:hydroxymethylbilane synthase
LRRLGGGCYVPVGARATVAGNELKIVGVVANPDGSSLCRGEIAGRVDTASELGRELADRLLHQGADKILAGARNVG